MQTVTLQMSDSVAEHIMYFLRQLPKKEVNIVTQKQSVEEKIAQKVATGLKEMKSGKTRSIDELFREI